MTREALPARRRSIQFTFARGSIEFIGCIGFAKDRRPLEVFLSCGKTTTEIEALGRDAAILVSLALQYGCSFDTMRGAITRSHDGTAATLVGQLLDEIEKIHPAEVAGMLGGSA